MADPAPQMEQLNIEAKPQKEKKEKKEKKPKADKPQQGGKQSKRLEFSPPVWWVLGW